jgi:PASTA domain
MADNFFTQKAGPLPVWGWSAIGAGGLGIVWWWRKNHPSTPITGSTSPVATSTGTSSTGTSTGVSGDIAGMYGPPSTPGTFTGAPVTTNPTGLSPVDVPNVIGLPQVQAMQVLSDQNLKPVGTPIVPGRTLTVDAQEPKGGSSVTPYTPVILVSSVHRSDTGGPTSSGQVTVPRVIGMKQDTAFAKITAAGLKPSGPAPVKGKTHYVTSQSPAPGRKVDHGSTVTVKSIAR